MVRYKTASRPRDLNIIINYLLPFSSQSPNPLYLLPRSYKLSNSPNMLGSTILSVFAALSFGLVSVATPLQPRTSELKTRDETIGSILGSLSSQIGGPIDQLSAYGGSDTRNFSLTNR